MKIETRSKFILTLVLGLAMGAGTTQLVASQGEPGDLSVVPAGSGPGGGDQSPGRIKNIKERFATSLHNTRIGKKTYYSAEDGFGKLTGVPYDNLACKGCHNNTVFPDWEEPVCLDCHAGAEDNPPDYTPPDDETCLGCHGRQNAEHNMLADVHRDDYDMFCMDCHAEEEVHGDGNAYLSMQEPGVFKISCADAECHRNVVEKNAGAANEKPSQRARKFHMKHLDTVDCSACHAESVIACDSCHFDTEVAGTGKRFYRKIPQKGFKLLVNHHGKVRTASYQSLTWGTSDLDASGEPAGEDVEDVGFYVIAPYTAHSVTRADNLECNDCHVKVKGKTRIEGNAAIKEYLETGHITVNQWDETAGPAGMLLAPTGIIPVPPDWQDALLFDFAYYLNSATDPITKDPDGITWGALEPGTVGMHMPYGAPLTVEQMDKLISGGQ